MPTDKLYGIGTDGAPVMTGIFFLPFPCFYFSYCFKEFTTFHLHYMSLHFIGPVNGVVKQLSDGFPMIIGVACVAHRLALACRDASNGVRYMAVFRDHLQELNLYSTTVQIGLLH